MNAVGIVEVVAFVIIAAGIRYRQTIGEHQAREWRRIGLEQQQLDARGRALDTREHNTEVRKIRLDELEAGLERRTRELGVIDELEQHRRRRLHQSEDVLARAGLGPLPGAVNPDETPPLGIVRPPVAFDGHPLTAGKRDPRQPMNPWPAVAGENQDRGAAAVEQSPHHAPVAAPERADPAGITREVRS